MFVGHLARMKLSGPYELKPHTGTRSVAWGTSHEESPARSGGLMMATVRPLALSVFSLCALATTLGARQTDTVRVGSAALHGARLRAGTYAIESFRRVDGVDTPISTTTQSIARSRQGDREIYAIYTTHISADGDTTVASIVMRAADFALLHHRVKAAHDSVAVTANAGHLTGWVVLPDEPIRLIDRGLERPVFPIEGQMPWLWPLLPLEDDYAAAIPHFSAWQGAEEWATIRVVASELLQDGGQPRDCWKVDAGELWPGARVTHWVEKSTRHILRSVLRGSGSEPEYWSRPRTP